MDESRPPKVFFIVGFSRSGTTLMSSLLDGHPSIAVTPETSLLLPFNRKRVRAACAGDRSALSALLSGWAIEADAVASRLGWSEGPGLALPLSPEALMRAILEAYAERFGAGYVGEKTPMHALHLKTLWRWFPEAKVVAMVRDGRDAVPSLLKLPGKVHDPALLALWWSKTARVVWEASRRWPGRVKLVRFEDLVAGPEPVLDEVLSFLGVEASSRDALEAGRSTALVLEGEAWKQKVREPVDASRAGAWRREVDRSGMRRADVLMSGMLARLGYPEPARCGWVRRAWCVGRAQGLRAWRALCWYGRRGVWPSLGGSGGVVRG